MSAALEIRAWSPEEPPVYEALARLFPGAAGWDWAFRQNPGGLRLFLARRAGRVVAQCAALPVRTRVLGAPRTFANLLDTFVRPEERESGALLATAQAFLAAHGGPEQDLVHYGWPNAHDLAFGKAHLEHELLRVSSLLVREPGAGPAGLPEGVRELEHFGPAADVLYACCATHWNASAIRDAAFLNWRFARNPLQRYRLLAVGDEQVLRGYAVYRPAPELQPGLGLVLDWLVLPGDDEASARLVAAVLACARADGARVLAASFPEWSPWSLSFQEQGFQHRPSEHLQLVRSAVPRFDMLWLRDNWWTTLADALLL